MNNIDKLRKWHAAINYSITGLPFPRNIQFLRENINSLSDIKPSNEVELNFFLDLTHRTPVISRSSRSAAIRKLKEIGRTPITVPKNIDLNFKELLETAIDNETSGENSPISRLKPKAKRKAKRAILFIQTRYFEKTPSGPLSIPHSTTQNFYSTLLNCLEEDGFEIVPRILPTSNILPDWEYSEKDLIIGLHTYGESKSKRALHTKIGYFENCSYLNRGGYGPFAKKGGEDEPQTLPLRAT